MKKAIKTFMNIALIILMILSFISPLMAEAKVITPDNRIVNDEKNLYNVKLFFNDGTGKTDSFNVKPNGKFPELPKPTRKDYKFEGWFTAENGGTKVESGTDYLYDKDINLYAHWKLINIEGKVKYEGYEMYYYNSYFNHTSTEFDTHLATLSEHMTLFSMNLTGPESMSDTKWFEGQSNRVKGFFETIGFENFEANSDYHNKTGFDTIGVAIASKKINDYTVIAVVPRSGSYFSEWGNNVWLGDGSQSDYMHEGWYNAANKLLDFLDEYVAKNNITGNVKLWMAGYSRGGATTNIAAGLLDNKLDKGQKIFSNGAKLTHDNLYAYTFEAPQGANYNSKTVKPPKDKIYNNIWNIVNPNDLVTKVAMVEFGFTRFGKDKFISTKLYNPSTYDGDKHTFTALFSQNGNQFPYYADQFEMYEAISLGSKDVTKSNYDANIVSILLLESITKTIGTRDTYVSQYQTPLRDALLKAMSDNPDISNNAVSDLSSSCLLDILSINAITIDPNIFNTTNYPDLKTDYKDSLLMLTPLLKSLANEIPNELISVAVQGGYIFQNHEPDVTLVHLKSQDSYYVDDYNKEYKESLNLIPLMDDADLYRVYLYGFNDLQFGFVIDGKLDPGTRVNGQIITKSSVTNYNRMVAVGYYSYFDEEKVEFFIPAKFVRYNPNRFTYKMQIKSYSIKPEHTISYTTYYQPISGYPKTLDYMIENKVNFNSKTYELDITLKDFYYAGTAFGAGSIVIISIAGVVLIGLTIYSFIYVKQKKNKQKSNKDKSKNNKESKKKKKK